MRNFLARLLCSIIGHAEEYDDEGPWGPYGVKCTRCGNQTFHIHDM